MGLSKGEALKIMNLQEGVDKEAIRQTYKELALRWHPDKHNETAADKAFATKKFQEISCAYKKLTTDDDSDDDEYYTNIYAARDMCHLFRHMYFAERPLRPHAGLFGTLLEEMMHNHMHQGYEEGSYFEDGDIDMRVDDDYDVDDDVDDGDDFFDYDGGTSDFFMQPNRRTEESFGAFRRFHQVTEEEALRNAQELMEEEAKEKEEAKKKEDKRKNKNKRKKEAKKRKKAAQSGSKTKGSGASKKSESDLDDESAEEGPVKADEDGEFDMASAFVKGCSATAASAATSTTGAHGESSGNVSPAETGRGNAGPAVARASVGETTPAHGPVSDETDDVTVHARSYAMRGNELAQLGHYQAAIDMFSEAIKLHDSDHRYYGNRSYCYDRLAQYHRAESDANRAIDLSPEWPKGYFRRARALAGQRQWKEAEDSFEVVLALDPSCTDASVELKKIRSFQLTEMGFSQEQSLLAIEKYQTVPQALDALLSGAVLQPDPNSDAAYIADDMNEPVVPDTSVQFTSRDDLRTPNPSTGICSIWVGNVNHDVLSQAAIRGLFAKYGEISSIRKMPTKHCVFVNFCTAQAAANAMRDLQGYFIGDMNLTVRYPDSYLPAQETLDSQRGAASHQSHGRSGRGSHAAAAPRQRLGPQARAAAVRQKESRGGSGASPQSSHASRSPVECKNWRANGCSFGKRCRYTHIPANKGVDAR